jgi:hypothetical protein
MPCRERREAPSNGISGRASSRSRWWAIERSSMAPSSPASKARVEVRDAATVGRCPGYVPSAAIQALAAASWAAGNTRASPGIIQPNNRDALAIHSVSVTIAERRQAP